MGRRFNVLAKKIFECIKYYKITPNKCDNIEEIVKKSIPYFLNTLPI